MHNETAAAGAEGGEALPSITPAASSSDLVAPIKITIRPTKVGHRGQYYEVLHDGHLLIAKTRNPSLDACRVLVSLGHVGSLEVWDEERSYPRLRVRDIVRAAALTVAEGELHGPRIVPYRAMEDDHVQRLKLRSKEAA
ncbi:hypothetical protein [Rhizobium sp. 42MFCr.1]|uniref:hypothetical protein n=1 Tax=Rhizobium sp. 42MFCr.1 TaxID=1048680 RepID=UPI0003676657|nr:hypothetical protein [Rhizobium sp. 42MFCr.1]